MTIIPMVFRSIDLMMTRRCNLRCAFCYIKNKTDVNDPDEVERNLKIVNLIIAQWKPIERLPDNQQVLQINLYGGEPTCAWESIKALVKLREEIKLPKLQLSIITNMSLLDEDKLNYCIVNRIGVHPSIDGCKEVEDMFRKTAQGITVSDKVYENAKRLISKLPYRSCRSTVCPETIPYMFKSIKFLCEEIGFHTVNQVMAGGLTWTEKDIEGIKEQTRLITDWWLDWMRKGVHYDIYYLRNMFMGIWNPMANRNLCSAGLGRVAIDFNGNIYPCHRFCNENTPKEYLLGNIFDKGVVNEELQNKLLTADIALLHKDKCSNCPVINSCHALCLHEMMLAGKGMFEPLDHYCKIWKIYYPEALRAHAILIAEKNKLYIQIYKPKPQVIRPVQGRQNVHRL